ncbi:hypothetical protein [Cytobacillus praedii]|uniref:hypothetical protein n=1 Tax=Cytobacillus praedii TaxID=1742358 RepID=UPI002E1A7BBC|nr:hypothetical protein [Cytobacillus praedii]
MKTIKRLQKLLAEGKITQEEYKEQLQEFLDDGIIKQEEFDGAKDFQPQNKDEDLIYSQEDVNRMITSKARKMVKKALTDAGVNLDGVENNDLLDTFGNLALQGQKKGNLSVDETQLNDLQKKAKAYDQLQPQVKGLTIENAVLKAAGTYNPVNPKQVVRALEDYKEYLEYDEDDVLVPKSVEKALKKLAEAEPNLFSNAGTGNEEDLEGGSGTGTGTAGFQGKPPGGGAGGGSQQQQKQAKLKAEALAMLNITQQKQ